MPPNFHQTPHGDRGCSRLQESQCPCHISVLDSEWDPGACGSDIQVLSLGGECSSE